MIEFPPKVNFCLSVFLTLSVCLFLSHAVAACLSSLSLLRCLRVCPSVTLSRGLSVFSVCHSFSRCLCLSVLLHCVVDTVKTIAAGREPFAARTRQHVR